LLARQKVLWEEVLRRDPKLPGGYVGMAEYQYTEGDVAAAERTLDRGLRECGPGPDLVIAAAKFFHLTDPKRGLEFLERTVRERDMTPVMCQVFDEVAAQAGRPDKAIEVCQRALKL